MVKAEKAFKWGIAILVVFGILNAFYFLNIVVGLKIVLPILCVFLIGSILLQSGKGGGLAAIGGLGDQAAFGTRTSSFLTQITYLIGAAFIVATIFLFKLSVPVKSINTFLPHQSSDGHHDHDHPNDHHEHDENCQHDGVPHAAGETGDKFHGGMQNTVGKPAQPKAPIQASGVKEAPQGQPAGMNLIEEKQTSGAAEKPGAGEQ